MKSFFWTKSEWLEHRTGNRWRKCMFPVQKPHRMRWRPAPRTFYTAQHIPAASVTGPWDCKLALLCNRAPRRINQRVMRGCRQVPSYTLLEGGWLAWRSWQQLDQQPLLILNDLGTDLWWSLLTRFQLFRRQILTSDQIIHEWIYLYHTIFITTKILKYVYVTFY